MFKKLLPLTFLLLIGLDSCNRAPKVVDPTSPGTDRAQLQQLTQANNRLPRLRYDQQSMAVSDRIDAYDAAQDSLLHVVYDLALPVTGAPTPTIATLAQSVREADDQVITYRLRYDEAAKHFNDYLQQHQEGLTSLGGKYAKLQPLPLFAIGQ